MSESLAEEGETMKTEREIDKVIERMMEAELRCPGCGCKNVEPQWQGLGDYPFYICLKCGMMWDDR